MRQNKNKLLDRYKIYTDKNLYFFSIRLVYFKLQKIRKYFIRYLSFTQTQFKMCFFYIWA